MKHETKVNREFVNFVGKLTNWQFWDYISLWYDEQHVLDIMSDWDTETKEAAIKEMKVLLKNTKKIEIEGELFVQEHNGYICFTPEELKAFIKDIKPRRKK